MKRSLSLVFFLLTFQLNFAFAGIALIDGDENFNNGYGGSGQMHGLLTTMGVNFDTYGGHSAGQSTQILYDNLNSVDMIIFGQFAGYNTGIQSVIQNAANQAALNTWLSNGGKIAMFIYNDGGQMNNFLNLPGISGISADSPASPHVLNDDSPILHLPNEIQTQLQNTRSWEAITSLPTGATNVKEILHYSGAPNSRSMVTFDYGAGQVFWTGIPVLPTANQVWPGMETLYPGSSQLFMENLFSTMGVSSAVPEPSTYAMLALGLLGLGYIRKRRIRR